MVEAFEREKADKMLLLGDILYHGPRNDLPREYAPKEVIAMLNEIKDKLFCVRGNCDTEVDQMVLDFPVLADYCILFVNGHTIFVTHGHLYSESNPPKLQKGDVLLTGHTHVPKLVDHSWYYVNPGSVSIPKENSHHGYMTLENGVFIWKDLNGNEKMQFEL